jgi:malate dehydrogenase (oxaloacetate-decarboxylating)(NADP+)
MIRPDEALSYHGGKHPGKIALRGMKPCLTARDMRLAYIPGATFACAEVARDAEAAVRYTARGNLVAVVTNGSAVPGLGNVGPLAAKPMQEGMSLLFKRLADIDVFDLEIDAADPDRFVEVVQRLEPTFGAIVIKDVRAPEGLAIYDRLRDALNIPVLHENLHSTAVVAMAALSNALDLADKDVADVKVVICGAGTVGLGCARLAIRLGVNPDSLVMYDVNGLLRPDRADLNPYQREFARDHGALTLDEGLRGADVFIGASTGAVLSQDAVRAMARFPIVFPLATPEPEIGYEAARASRRDAIVATALTQCPNAIVDLLSAPFVLRGALDVQATRITEDMLLAAAGALAGLAREEVPDEVSRAYGHETFSFGPEYLLPKPIDQRILVREPAAVAARALADGVARHPVDTDRYQESLRVRIGTGRETLRRLMMKARNECPRVVFPDGTHETVLRACSMLADEGVARPVLLGHEADVRAAIEQLGLDSTGVTVVDPSRSTSHDRYVEEYFEMRRRRGVMRTTADERLRRPDYFAAMMLHSGDVDMMVSGIASHYTDSLRVILEVVGTAPGVQRISSHYMVLLHNDVFFLADCAVNIDPGAEVLAEIALLTARRVQTLGIEPRVALLSFSNFGSVDHPFADRVRQATAIVKSREPDLVVDGEMQLAAAVSNEIRAHYFPFSTLKDRANVLVFPDLQSGNTAMHVLQHMGDAVVVGPVLMGTRLPVHLIQYGNSAEDVVNLTATGIVEAAGLRQAAGSPPGWASSST